MPWQPTKHLECNHALLKVDFEHEHVLEADTELSSCYVPSKKQNKTLFETDYVNILEDQTQVVGGCDGDEGPDRR
jgi:hypothetical protein